jgi:hypothetical protein
VLRGSPTAKITSRSLKFEIVDVASALANEVTGDQWNAYRGMKDDNFPEVPPDGARMGQGGQGDHLHACTRERCAALEPAAVPSCRSPAAPPLRCRIPSPALPRPPGNVTLSFNFPVTPADLQAALQLASCCKRDDAKGRTLRVLPCAGSRAAPRDPLRPAAAADAARANSTCAVVQVLPGLKAGEAVTLRLPKGAAYSPYAGKARESSEVYLWGLRRFRIPLRDNFQQLTGPNEVIGNDDNAVSYTRASMWLPHGLAAGVKVSDLAGQISLCRYRDPYKWSSPCDATKFTLERVNRGKLVMRVPTFAPREHYRLRVAGNPAVGGVWCCEGGGRGRRAGPGLQ